MKIRSILRHTAVAAAGLILLLGVPFVGTGALRALTAGGADAVSGASVILAQPSGEYVALINAAMHPDRKKLEEWATFFGGGEISYIFEDISCSVPKGDAGALETAKSFQSRLPENQMKIVIEDPTLLLSRADGGNFDILILSREFAEAYHAGTAEKEPVRRIEFEGAAGSAAESAEEVL